MFETVYANCIVTLITLLYYCVGKFLVNACYPQKKDGRKVMLMPRAPDGSYRDMQCTPTEVVWGVPRLTLQNVWILVYGVGCILFIAGYCILGLQPVCLACFGLAASILSVDELVCPRENIGKLYISARCAALLAGLVSLLLVSLDLFNSMFMSFVQNLDFYSLLFGLCFPFVAQFLMVAVRDSRHYTLGSILEVCEFGLPFTVFLAVYHLSVAYGQRVQLDGRNATTTPVFRTDPPFIIFYSVAPVFVAPSLIAYVSCVLDGSAIDTLISTCFTLCMHYMFFGRASALGIYGAVCCGVAVIVRVVTEYTPLLGESCIHNEQQLPQHVVWQRSRELTSILETEEG